MAGAAPLCPININVPARPFAADDATLLHVAKKKRIATDGGDAVALREAVHEEQAIVVAHPQIGGGAVTMAALKAAIAAQTAAINATLAAQTAAINAASANTVASIMAALNAREARSHNRKPAAQRDNVPSCPGLQPPRPALPLRRVHLLSIQTLARSRTTGSQTSFRALTPSLRRSRAHA
eukprot:m.209542 g.209542  ORF g.209542 m.209542 type:complete len:181 (-) comp10728_c1_seq4:396-938(-)